MTIEQLPWPRYIGIKHRKMVTLPKDLIVEQWVVPQGTKVTIFQSKNFGHVVLAKGTKDKRGFVIPRTIFRW